MFAKLVSSFIAVSLIGAASFAAPEVRVEKAPEKRPGVEGVEKGSEILKGRNKETARDAFERGGSKVTADTATGPQLPIDPSKGRVVEKKAADRAKIEGVANKFVTPKAKARPEPKTELSQADKEEITALTLGAHRLAKKLGKARALEVTAALNAIPNRETFIKVRDLFWGMSERVKRGEITAELAADLTVLFAQHPDLIGENAAGCVVGDPKLKDSGFGVDAVSEYNVLLKAAATEIDNFKRVEAAAKARLESFAKRLGKWKKGETMEQAMCAIRKLYLAPCKLLGEWAAAASCAK